MDTNLYFDSSINNNGMESDNQYTESSPNVKQNYVFMDANTHDLKVGSMPINSAQHIHLDPKSTIYPNNYSYTIPEGYHDGTGTVSVGALKEYTYGNAEPQFVANNKIYWINGERCVGTLGYQTKQKVRIRVGEYRFLPAGYYPNGVAVYGIESAPVLDLTGTSAYKVFPDALQANDSGTVDSSTHSFIVNE